MDENEEYMMLICRQRIQLGHADPRGFQMANDDSEEDDDDDDDEGEKEGDAQISTSM